MDRSRFNFDPMSILFRSDFDLILCDDHPMFDSISIRFRCDFNQFRFDSISIRFRCDLVPILPSLLLSILDPIRSLASPVALWPCSPFLADSTAFFSGGTMSGGKTVSGAKRRRDGSMAKKRGWSASTLGLMRRKW